MSAESRRRAVAVVAIAAFVGISAWAADRNPQRRTFSEVPEFIPGAVTVTGSVSVENSPTVQAQQSRAWRVSLAEAPVVSWRAPPFVEVGRHYRFTWSADEAVTYRVVEPGLNGWIRVELVDQTNGGNTWLNLGRMTTIEEATRRPVRSYP